MTGIEYPVVRSTFIGFCFFATVFLIWLLSGICKRKILLELMRWMSIIPLALGGSMATYHFNDIRGFPFKDQYRTQTDTLRAVYGLSAISMDFAAAWFIIAGIILSLVKEKSSSTAAAVKKPPNPTAAAVKKPPNPTAAAVKQPSTSTPATAKDPDRRPSSAYFYLMIVDIAVFSCLLASTVIARTFIPLEIRDCSSPAYTESLPIALLAKATNEQQINACGKGFYIQAMTGISATITLCLIMIEAPLVNLPNGMRFALFFVIRLIGRPGLNHRDLEMGGVFKPLTSDEKQDHEQEVARQAENHPHYAELVAIIEESRAILSPEHLESVVRRSCVGKTKSQCWACDGIICNECTTTRSDIPVPRTTDHIVHCLAMCTPCYLVKGSSQPATFSATLNPTDLSRQHHNCKFEEKERPEAGRVSLCWTCVKQSPDDISTIRETREAKMLALTLKRGILCAGCEKLIPKNKRRWWICGEGDHDCHWGGHEVSQ